MENKVVLNPKEIFSSAFGLTKKHFKNFFIVLICFVILSILDPRRGGESSGGLAGIIVTVASIYLSVTTFAAVFKIVRGEETKLKDFFTWPKSGFKMLFTSIVTGLILLPVFITGAVFVFSSFSAALSSGVFATVPFVIFILTLLATMYFSIRLVFAKFYSLENNAMPSKSIQASWNATKGKFWSLLWMLIICAGVAILGLLALLIGLFWAIPTILIAQVIIYKKLMGTMQTSVVQSTVNPLPEVQPLELQANSAPASSIEGAQN